MNGLRTLAKMLFHQQKQIKSILWQVKMIRRKASDPDAPWLHGDNTHQHDPEVSDMDLSGSDINALRGMSDEDYVEPEHAEFIPEEEPPAPKPKRTYNKFNAMDSANGVELASRAIRDGASRDDILQHLTDKRGLGLSPTMARRIIGRASSRVAKRPKKSGG